jgi:hypothetical protein
MYMYMEKNESGVETVLTVQMFFWHHVNAFSPIHDQQNLHSTLRQRIASKVIQ